MKKNLLIIALVALVLFTSCVGDVKSFRETHQVTFSVEGTSSHSMPPQLIYHGEKAYKPYNPSAEGLVFFSLV